MDTLRKVFYISDLLVWKSPLRDIEVSPYNSELLLFVWRFFIVLSASSGLWSKRFL